MKRYLYRIMAVAAIVLAAASCNVAEEDPATPAGQLTINLDSGFLQTRTANVTFEGKIDHFDFFFFTDAEGDMPVEGMHGRVTGSSTTLDATGDYSKLRHITSYVYILANYPDELSHSRDWTLEQLLDLELDHPLAKRVTVVNPETDAEEETDEIEFCDYLVMDSYDAENGTYTTEIAPQTFNETRTVTILLSRIAAKLTMEITVPKTVSTGEELVELWTPVVKDIQAYYVNALNNKPNVDGAPVQRSSLTSETGYDYMTYPTSYPLTRREGDAIVFDTDPVYTYPQEWTMGENGEPYFKIAMPWNGSLHGTSNFYYKVTAPEPVDDKITLNRNCWYKISVTLSVLESEEEYVEVRGTFTVAPWASGIDGGASLSSATFFNVPVTNYTLYSQDSIMIPFSSSSAVNAYFTSISYTHYGASSTNDGTFSYPYSFDFSTNPSSDVTLPTTDSNGQTVLTAARDINPYSLKIEGKNVKFKHSLANIYTVRNVTFVIENADGRSAVVTIVQHPAIELKKILAKNAFVNGHFARNDKDTKDITGTYLIGEKYGPTEEYDAGLYKYYSHEYLIDQTIQSPNGNTVKTVDLSSFGLGNIYSDWKSSVHASQTFLVEVTVSAFDETNNTYKMSDNGTGSRTENFIIGDPRVKASEAGYTTAQQAGWSSSSTTNFWLPDYLAKDSYVRTGGSEDGGWEYTTGDFEHGAWEEPLKVMIASQGTDAKNVIAPRFLISSTLNGMNPGTRFDGAVRRAAVYQENGYPAGRWRLPTEAEIAFIAARQIEGALPEIFVNGTTKYWCANRSYVELEGYSAETGIKTFAAGNATGYNRFVYDLWYWGDEPEDPDVYHPNMHEH